MGSTFRQLADFFPELRAIVPSTLKLQKVYQTGKKFANLNSNAQAVPVGELGH
jgi:hypothetical protein